jgi:AcrR family transcriptional regulator
MGTVRDRPSLREEQKALTRRRLLDAAEVVFARRGFHGASVDEIAREAGATTGALYSNFTGKEDLFLALFERSTQADVHDYAEISTTQATPDEQTRAVADLWMQILRERPHYFPLVVEFWAYAMREPQLRERLAERFRTLRAGSTSLVAQGAERRGITLSPEFAQRLGLLITALGNGLALEKLLDPDAIADETYGDLLVLIFNALVALARADDEIKPTRRKDRAHA